MTYYKIIKSNDLIYDVILLPYKNTNTWSFINLTKKHICSCKFSSQEEALEDLEDRKNKKMIIDYYVYTM